ncbi:hypothetical protein PFDG_05284, partial [Plasmodium falciparum Dd2]
MNKKELTILTVSFYPRRLQSTTRQILLYNVLINNTKGLSTYMNKKQMDDPKHRSHP